MGKCRALKHMQINGKIPVAVSKIDGTKFYDIKNKGGFITSYIRNVLKIDVPSLPKRQKYKRDNGIEWWEQWFDIKYEEQKPTLKCPYCDWETYDINNKSGCLTIHIKDFHKIPIEEHLKKFPNDAKYFPKDIEKIKRENDLKNEENFVICPICQKKFKKLTVTHITKKHELTFQEFKEKYPDVSICSETMKEQVKSIQILSNMSVSKKRFISSYEKEIVDFLEKNGLACEHNRQLLIGKELDIYVPEKRIAIEFNGLLWHTEGFGKKDRNYHLNKTKACNKVGVGLIHIFEDEYVNRKDVVLSKIRHIFGIENPNTTKIGGRKCIVEDISNNEAEDFLNAYHIQGFSKSTVYLGAKYNNELVAVMSFKHGGISSPEWDLTRFATKDGYIYQGVGSKLFKHFVKQYSPNKVISFADRRWTIDINNNLYTKMGFIIEKINGPDYRYYNASISKFERIHKFLFNKRRLSKKYGLPLSMTEKEMSKKLGYDRIWDCGLVRYAWINEKSPLK